MSSEKDYSVLPEVLEEFDRVMFKSLVRKITVLSNKEIEIEFECGITVRETL